MFLPKFLQQDEESRIFDLIREFPFATLNVITENGIETDHLPLLLESTSDQNLVLVGHLAKVNSLCKENITGKVKVVFHGPNAYISPNWYPSKKAHGRAVPTWNYIVVHIDGVLSFIDEESWKFDLLDKQSKFHEKMFDEKWQLSDAPEDYIKGMLNGIIGVKIQVTNIVGKWKVSKEKSEEDKQGVRDGLSNSYDANITRMLVSEK